MPIKSQTTNSASNADVTVLPSQFKVTRSQQCVVATVEESVLKTEMAGRESQEEDAPKRILFFKIRPHRRDESWSASLWQTFFSASMGAQIPVIAERPLATSGCRKFQLDPLGDHLNTCTAHSGAKKAHDWMVDQVADLFRTTHKVTSQHVVQGLPSSFFLGID